MGQLLSKKKEEENICPYCRCKRKPETETTRRLKRVRITEQEDGEVDDFSMFEQQTEEARNLPVTELPRKNRARKAAKCA